MLCARLYVFERSLFPYSLIRIVCSENVIRTGATSELVKIARALLTFFREKTENKDREKQAALLVRSSRIKTRFIM